MFAKRFILQGMKPRHFIGALAAVACVATAQTDDPVLPLPLPPPAKDIHETVMRVAVSAKNLAGESFSADINVTVYKPDGDGPFPLVVFNHGRAEDPNERRKYPRVRYTFVARYFIRKGFAVAVPTRLGYGDTTYVGDPESRGATPCPDMRSDAMLAAGTQQIKTVIDHLRRDPRFDTTRIVLAGESVGGYITVAAASAKIPGVVAAINFSGGTNGNPAEHAGEPCGEAEIQESLARAGASNTVPTLWMYAENDDLFGPAFARRAHKTFTTAGGQAELIVLPPVGDEGHALVAVGNDVWQPLADAFLDRFGFHKPGAIRPLKPSNYATIDNTRAPPFSTPARQDLYQKFLAAKGARALAISSDRWAMTTGDDAPSRALAGCQQESEAPCRLYAVDDLVVWDDEPWRGVQSAR